MWVPFHCDPPGARLGSRDRGLTCEVLDYTTNPFNRKLTCGGSSGGEGALLALRGEASAIYLVLPAAWTDAVS